MAPQAIVELIKKEERRNQEMGEAMLNNFTDKTRNALNSEFLDNIEQIIVHHLEVFLAPPTALAVASSIVNDMRGQLTDAINDTQDNAIKIVERYTNHFSSQIKQAIKHMNKEA
jgi:hypothetical protein